MDIIKKQAIKAFMPMVKENIPIFENFLCDYLNSIDLTEWEDYTGIVLTSVNDKIMITLCAFDCDNSVTRQIRSMELTQFIEIILKGEML